MLTLAHQVLLSSVVISGGLAAQDRPTFGPRSFFPHEYTSEYYADVDALQDTIIWDALERSVMAGPMRTLFRKAWGFRIDDVKTVRSASRYLGEKDAGEAGPRDVNVTVIEGKGVRLPPIAKEQSFTKLAAHRIGGVDVVREWQDSEWSSWKEGKLYAVPKPGVLIYGSEAMIRSVLVGKRRGGVISSRLMALTATRKPLAYVAQGFPPPSDERYETTLPFDAGWHTPDDPLQHLVARCLVDEKTEKVTIRLKMRFKTGKQGPAILEEGMKAQVEAMKAQKIYQVLKLFFEKITWQQDGQDLNMAIELDKGDVKNLFSTGGLMPFLFLSRDVAGVAPVAPVEAGVIELKKEPKPKPKAKQETQKKRPE